MNEFHWKKPLTAILSVLALALLLPGCGSDEIPYAGSINVSGKGTAYAQADVASIVFGVDISESRPDVAVESAAELMDEAFEAAVGLGIPESDIKTVSYNLFVEDQYDYSTYQYTGEVVYHLTHYAQVEVRDLDMVGEVLSALVESGSNTVRGVSFRVEDTEGLLEEARELAIADARGKAEQLASQLGMEVGDATYVNEWTDYYSTGSTVSMGGEFVMDMAVPSIDPGTQSVSLNVQITFQLVKAR